MQYKIISVLFSLLLFSSACQSKSTRAASSEDDGYILGKVIRIVDGDTYDLLVEGNKTIRIRMEGIDAPERGMPFYNSPLEKIQ